MASVVFRDLSLFILVSLAFQVDSYRQHQVLTVVSDVHEYYGTTSIFFAMLRNNRCLEDYTLAHSISRDLSRKYHFTSMIHLDQLDQHSKWYQDKISRSLIVIFLRSLSDIADLTGKFIRKSYVWLVIFTNDSGSSAVCEYCEFPKGNRFELRFDTEMLVLCCDSLVLKDWWSIDGDDTEVSNFAVWTDQNREKLEFLAPAELAARRHELKGAGLRIALVKSSPFAYEIDGEIRGLFGDILAELRHSMNFTIKEIVQYSMAGEWQSKTKNWTGAIGHVLRGDADLGVAPFAMTKRRLEVLDYTLSITVQKYRLFIGDKDSSHGVNWTAYLQIFSINIWIAIILLMILASTLLAVITSFKNSRSLPSLIVESHLHVWGIFCQQGLSYFPAEASLRIAYLSVFILAFIIYAVYSATLVSFLTILPSTLPFTTLEGFVNDGSYRLIVLKNSGTYDFLEDTTEPVFKEMMKLMKPVEELPETMQAGWEQVCDEKVALYSHGLPGKNWRNFVKCEIAEVYTTDEDALSMVMPADSQYTSVINYHIQRFKDTGVMDRIKDKYYDSKSGLAETEFENFCLSDVAPALASLAVGLMLSLLVLLGEAMYYAREANLRSRRRATNSRNLWKKHANGRTIATQPPNGRIAVNQWIIASNN